MQDAHRRWFESNFQMMCLMPMSHEWHGIALSGPKSRTLLADLMRDDIASMKFRDLRKTFVAGVPVVSIALAFL